MKMISLDEISTIVTGGTPSTEKKEYWDGGNIPWLQSGCCQNCYVNSASAYITKLGYDNSSTRMMPKDTVLIALTGATAGKVGYLTFEACANQSVTGITPKKGYSPKFIYYYLQYLRPKILFDCIGGAQPHISQGYVKKIQIPEIDLESQEKIVEQIDNIKNEISNCEHQLSLFDELVKSRFIEMFGTLDMAEQRDDWMRLDEVSEIVTGTTPSTRENDNWDGDILWVTPAELKVDSFYVNDTARKITEKGRKSKGLDLMPVGTVLLSSRAPIGKVAIVGKPMTCNQGFKNFICGNKINPIYLYVFLKSNSEYLNSIGSGTTFLEVSKSTISKTKIPVPSIELQNEFAQFVEQIDKSKFNVQSNIGKLNELLDKLMNDSFGGSLNA